MSESSSVLQVEPIGWMRTAFVDKFGVPRQSMMIREARGVLKLRPDPAFRTALNRLDEFSHLWIVFWFDRNVQKGWRPTIRPPRLDAPRRVGVFASRSPHRPNPIGMSAVKLDRIDFEAPGGIEIHVSGVDLLDGTPVLDIKPYLPFADCLREAQGGWAGSEIPRYVVKFSEPAARALEEAARSAEPRIRELVTEMLEWDPRPTSQRRGLPIEDVANDGQRFGFRVSNYDVQWEIREGAIHVLAVRPLPVAY